MHRNISIPTLVALIFALGISPGQVRAGDEGHDLGLVTWMGRLQYFTHKLGLAVSAQNAPLQGYYTHEVEEVIEELEDIEDFDGIEIGKLVKVNLVPAFEALESAVEIGDQSRIDSAYDAMLGACNTCHKAANRPYIHIVRRTDNPYMQDFSPAK